MFDWLKALFGLSDCRRCKFRRMWGLYCGFKYKKSWHLKSSAWQKYGCWHYVDNFEASYKREAQSIERIVRDAIIDYNEMYQSAPNDEAERDLRERAARANAWLKQHGFEEEPCYWSKEETPCL